MTQPSSPFSNEDLENKIYKIIEAADGHDYDRGGELVPIFDRYEATQNCLNLLLEHSKQESIEFAKWAAERFVYAWDDLWLTLDGSKKKHPTEYVWNLYLTSKQKG